MGNTKGSNNSASGFQALFANTTGNNNTASGYNALMTNTTGANNIALGYGAGQALTTGSNDIDVGSNGVAAESNTIRIGTQATQTTAYVAGIYGSTVTGDAVLVNSAGKLGMVMSSARFKRDIQDMGSKSGGLLKLRPVTFHYKNDPTGALQYGLVAEEVAKVYPELVSFGPDGKPMTVHYLMLSAMLLNELQKQATENQRLAAQVNRLSAQMVAMKTSTGREVAQSKASREQDLRSMQDRLATLEQAMKTRSGELAAAEPFNR